VNRFSRWNLRIYAALMYFYPGDLRRGFGPEMLEAFSRDLASEGAVRVWRITLLEVIRIAFPAWLQIPSVAVPALSSAAVVLSQLPLLIMTIPEEARPGAPTPLDALVALAIIATATALTSFVAVYPWKRAHIVSLEIGRSSCLKRAI
jgi:hypothetical protein